MSADVTDLGPQKKNTQRRKTCLINSDIYDISASVHARKTSTGTDKEKERI
jgi:hypothetical protein